MKKKEAIQKKKGMRLMNKSEFRGMGQVFKYTLVQYIKTPSVIVTFIIMMVCAMAVFPFLAMKNGKKVAHVNNIEKVYVINETSIEDPDFSQAIIDEDSLSGITFEYATEDKEELEERIKEDGANEVIICITLDISRGGYILDVLYSDTSDVKYDDASELGQVAGTWLQDYKFSSLSLSEATSDMAFASVDFEIIDANDYMADENVIEGIGDDDFWIVYLSIFIAYMVIALASGLISGKIVEEKSNRIVEYLMTTVRPMALITGKIFAMMVVTLVNCLALAGAGFISSKISSAIWHESASELVGGYFSADTLSRISLPVAILCVAFILIGIMIFGVVAGLFGASVTKMEELQQGMKGYTFMLLISFFLAYGALMVMTSNGTNPFIYFTMFFPLTAPMVMPGAILIGKIGFVAGVISAVIGIVTIVILFWFVSLVYEGVIMSNGSVVTFKSMLSMAKQRLSGKKVQANEK